MNKSLSLSLVIVVVSLTFSGCATIVGGGSSQTISINSQKPFKGTLKYSDGDGQQYFTSPATLFIERRSKDIVLESQDDQFQTQVVKSNLNPWFFGNLITGGPLGSTTDAASGAAWKYDSIVNISAK